MSMLIAWRVIYIQQGWINDDSVLYFEVARLFSLGEWQQGIKLYNWPLYPAIIGIIHAVTQLGIQRIAQVLDVLFFAITTCSYISLIRLAGGNKTTILCSVLLLFSTPYIVGDVLPMLLRDQGFWAFFLLSISYFIRFYRAPKFQTGLLWQTTAIIAVLFRIEAITFLALLPLILLSEKKPNRIKAWTYANSLSLLAFTGIILVLIFHPTAQLADFGRLNELATIGKHSYLDITQVLTHKADMMGEQVLGGFLAEYGMVGLLLTLITIVLFKSITAAGGVVTLILAVNLKQSVNKIAPDARKIFYWLISLAVLNAVVIVINTFVLSGRYLISLGFILLVFSAFGLTTFIESSENNFLKKALFILIMSLLGISFIHNLQPKSSEYNYEQQAVSWLKNQNTTNATVLYISPRVRFYAGATYTTRGYDFWQYTTTAIADGSIQKYDYLLINMMGENPNREKQLNNALPNYHLVKEFLGFKGKKKIMIFKKN
ncbi:MAG: hypothetical protein H7Z18_11470 [Methylophilaceae bacterium]|nr:hypothetical protein [Methylophilaceae bacterium]